MVKPSEVGAVASVAKERDKEEDECRRSTTIEDEVELSRALSPVAAQFGVITFPKELRECVAAEVEHCAPEITLAILDAKAGSSLRAI